MADVYTVFFIMIGILLSVPAILVACNLLMPNVTERVQTRLDKTPGKCFALGLPVTLILGIFAFANFESSIGLLQTLAFITLFFLMAIGTIGGSGMARLLGTRLAPHSKPNSNMAFLLRGAIVYEFACLVPIVGWFVFAPIIGITAIGATIFALLKWVPKTQPLVVQPASGD